MNQKKPLIFFLTPLFLLSCLLPLDAGPLSSFVLLPWFSLLLLFFFFRKKKKKRGSVTLRQWYGLLLFHLRIKLIISSMGFLCRKPCIKQPRSSHSKGCRPGSLPLPLPLPLPLSLSCARARTHTHANMHARKRACMDLVEEGLLTSSFVEDGGIIACI